MRCGRALRLLLMISGVWGCRQVTDSSRLLSSSATATPLPGIYMKQIVLASTSVASGLTLRAKTERLQLVTVERVGNALKARARTCGVRQVSSGGAEMTFPDAFVTSIPDMEQNYLILESDGNVALKSSPSIEVLGANLRDPEKDEMPNAASDPRVVDLDKDGKPGLTMNIKIKIATISIASNVFTIQRVKWNESSTSVTADRIEGTVDWTIDQHTLGSDSQILGRIKPKVTAVNQSSFFSMRKIPSESNCETVLVQAKSIFGKLKL